MCPRDGRRCEEDSSHQEESDPLGTKGMCSSKVHTELGDCWTEGCSRVRRVNRAGYREKSLGSKLVGRFMADNHPKFIYWNPNPQCNSIWRWYLWKVIRSWRWNHYKSNPRWVHVSWVATQQGVDGSQPGRDLAIDRPYGHLALRFPASQTVRNKLPLFVTLWVWSTFTADLTGPMINQEAHLWLWLWRCFQGGLSGQERQLSPPIGSGLLLSE